MNVKKVMGAGVLALGLGATLGAALSGCSSTPAPTAELAVSKTALANAVSAGGGELAPVELKTASDKIAQADKEMEKKNYKEARVLAEQATADARLAETKAQAAKAQKSLKESQEGRSALKEEMQRQQTP
jgi:septal ring factor EnvC (AmiA/AmiB activator)